MNHWFSGKSNPRYCHNLPTSLTYWGKDKWLKCVLKRTYVDRGYVTRVFCEGTTSYFPALLSSCVASFLSPVAVAVASNTCVGAPRMHLLLVWRMRTRSETLRFALRDSIYRWSDKNSILKEKVPFIWSDLVRVSWPASWASDGWRLKRFTYVWIGDRPDTAKNGCCLKPFTCLYSVDRLKLLWHLVVSTR